LMCTAPLTTPIPQRKLCGSPTRSDDHVGLPRADDITQSHWERTASEWQWERRQTHRRADDRLGPTPPPFPSPHHSPLPLAGFTISRPAGDDGRLPAHLEGERGQHTYGGLVKQRTSVSLSSVLRLRHGGGVSVCRVSRSVCTTAHGCSSFSAPRPLTPHTPQPYHTLPGTGVPPRTGKRPATCATMTMRWRGSAQACA
jgi:hypothetical protein